MTPDKTQWDGLIKALIDEHWSWSTNRADEDFSFTIGNWNVTLRRNGTWGIC